MTESRDGDGSGDADGPADGGPAAGVRPEIPGTGTDGADGAETVEPDVPTEDIDPELRTLFWKLVFLYKLTVIGGTLGVLLLVFDRGPDIGPELFGGALVALGYTLYRTGRAKSRIDAGEFHDDPGDGREGAER